MNIIEMDIEKVIPYENNPRKNEEAVDKVALSISAFGFKVPIVIDANNVVVTGHTRLKAAKKLGMNTVPCIKADDLTDEQIKAFRLADNKVAEFSQWDEDKLMQELVAYHSWEKMVCVHILLVRKNVYLLCVEFRGSITMQTIMMKHLSQLELIWNKRQKRSI